MYDHPAEQIAKPLLRTSPATNEALRECFLRAAFQTDQQYSDINPVSTYASLGSISHHLLEAASRGEFDDIRVCRLILILFFGCRDAWCDTLHGSHVANDLWNDFL